MRSYKPEELFDEAGRLIPELKDLAPKGPRRLSANPVANGGRSLGRRRQFSPTWTRSKKVNWLEGPISLFASTSHEPEKPGMREEIHGRTLHGSKRRLECWTIYK
jgi:hypothetical protein